jgi:hypothetical protein
MYAQLAGGPCFDHEVIVINTHGLEIIGHDIGEEPCGTFTHTYDAQTTAFYNCVIVLGCVCQTQYGCEPACCAAP